MKEIRAIRAFTVLEVMLCVGVILTLMALAYPVFVSAKETSAIQSSLSRLRQLHAAVTLYRADYESATITSSLPSHQYVYTSYLGFGKDFFRSPCGYRGIVPNTSGISYQYVFEPSPEVIRYFEHYGERSILFTDASCNPSRAIWESTAALKRGLAVRLDGSLVNVRRRGFPGVLSWWGF